MSTNKSYDDHQRAEFLELAQIIGIGRAIRELGYPSYPTAQKWCMAAGIEPNVDTAFAQMKQWHTFYQVEDLLLVGDEIMSTIQSMLVSADNADDVKKLTEAYQKATNTRLLLEGKSTSITEKREVSAEDTEFEKALREFRSSTSDTPRVNQAVDDLL
jgi:hypothetical protein